MLSDVPSRLINGTTFVSIRNFSSAMYPADVKWENGQAIVNTNGFSIQATPGQSYISANDRYFYTAIPTYLEQGRVMVPIRLLAKAYNAQVTWNPQDQSVSITRGNGVLASAASFYDANDLYWLSRIIYAESGGEPLRGQIAVGNVVLNRVRSSEYPNTVEAVIFDRNYGVQFSPVANGTIYNTPSASSIIAAKICLEGYRVVGESLYFFNPSLAQSFWIAQNRTYLMTIGGHQFYL